jgi:hypothetical protein
MMIIHFFTETLPRPLIGEHLLATEPEKVKQRLARRFKRKRYYAAGVNDVWAQDQHDKWGPQYGLWLHTSLDPHPGWINWMKVWWTNSNPRLITKYYLDSCRDMSGMSLSEASKILFSILSIGQVYLLLPSLILGLRTTVSPMYTH